VVAPAGVAHADRFDSDDVLFRVVMLAAMLAIAALAVQMRSGWDSPSSPSP
jgi:hypothetical protein